MFKIVLACVAAIIVAGCSNKQSSSDDLLAGLPGQEPITKSEFDLLKSQVDDLNKRRVYRTLLDHTSVSLNPNPSGFSLLDTPVGPIALRIDNVTAYANGSRVKLALGNTTNATLLKPKATIEWGSVNDKGEELEAAGTLTAHELSDRLEAGRWKIVTLPLANMAPEKLGYVRFTAGNIDGMELIETAGESQ